MLPWLWPCCCRPDSAPVAAALICRRPGTAFTAVIPFAAALVLPLLLLPLLAGVGVGLAAAMCSASMLESITANYFPHMIFRIVLHLKVGMLRISLPTCLQGLVWG